MSTVTNSSPRISFSETDSRELHRKLEEFCKEVERLTGFMNDNSRKISQAFRDLSGRVGSLERDVASIKSEEVNRRARVRNKMAEMNF